MIQLVSAYAHEPVHKRRVGQFRSGAEGNDRRKLMFDAMVVTIRQQLKKKVVVICWKITKRIYLRFAKVGEMLNKCIYIKMNLTLKPQMEAVLIDLIRKMLKLGGSDQWAIHQVLETFCL